MKTNLDEYKEVMHDVRRTLGSEKERLTERIEQLEGFMKMTDMTDELLSQIDDLNGENERLNVENERLRPLCRICNPAAFSIRIYNPLSLSVFRITNAHTYSGRIANPTEQSTKNDAL